MASPEPASSPSAEPASSAYWEVGGHPNFLLSVDERVMGAREKLAQIADTSLTLLLGGERGVGKEVVARGVHALSGRRDRPLVSLNAYAIPKSAIERELFDEADGKLASAGDGTLHIHGIELLPEEIQRRLLEWVRKRSMAGQSATIPRFILTYEQPSLEAEEVETVENEWGAVGGAVRIEIPPLRDRPEDVPLLANHILQKYGSFYNSKIKVLRSGFVRFLQRYRWPGNARELERIIRRFLVVEDEEMIRAELGSKQSPAELEEDRMIESGLGLKEIVGHVTARVERRVIARALERSRWNKKAAAADLDISYKSLLNKVKQYEIEC